MKPITLRPYQAAAVEGVASSLADHRSTLVVLPTATGKSITMMALAVQARDEGGATLAIVPAHLVDQIDAVAKSVGLRSSIERGEESAVLGGDVIVASADTLARLERLERLPSDAFDLILVDEAHHAAAETWRRAIGRFRSRARVVGFTATPDRADCAVLVPTIYEDVAYQYSIEDAQRDGWLCPITLRIVQVVGLTFDRVLSDTLTASESADLEAQLRDAFVVRRMAEPAALECGDRPTVVFCLSVAHAHAFAEYLRSIGKLAIAVDNSTPRAIRAEVEAQFRRGEIQFLCNVNCFSEGWDCPPVSAIVQAAPTQSRARYAQQIGRGLRLHPGKADCLIVDFAGNGERHSLVSAAHVLRPRMSDAAGRRASELVLEGATLESAIEQAEREEAQRIVLDDGHATRYTVIEHRSLTDFGRVADTLGVEIGPDDWPLEPTPAQVSALSKFGIETAPSDLTRRQASTLIDVLIKRAQARLASPKQIRKLIAAGTRPEDARRMSFDRASKGMRELAANGWRRPPSWGPRASP